MGEQIQGAGSAIPSIWTVFDPHKFVFDGTHKLLMNGTVYVSKGVERQSGRIMGVADGCCFGRSGACRDDGGYSRIKRRDDPCCQ